MQETPVQFLGQEDLLKRDRLPTSVFLGFSDGSAGKESTCNAEDLGLIPVFWPGEFQGLYSPWSRKQFDMTEQLSHTFHFGFREAKCQIWLI